MGHFYQGSMIPKLLFLLLIFTAGCITPASTISTPIITKMEINEPITDNALPLIETEVGDVSPEEIVAVEEKVVLSPEQQYWKDRVSEALGEDVCPPTAKINYPNSYYRGPLIDAHIHIPSIPDAGFGEKISPEELDEPTLGVNLTIADFACTFSHEGTKQALSYFAVWDPIAEQQLEVVKQTMEKYPGVFVPFAMTPDDDDNPNGFPTVDAETLDAFLNAHPGLFHGYGEIGLYAREEGSPALSPDSERLTKIYPIVRKHNLMVYFHLGGGMRKAFEKVLDENPDIDFIFHGDQLITYNDDGTQDLRYIDEILSKHPNVYYGVDELYGDVFLLNPETSKETFLEHFNNYKPLLTVDVSTWKAFIERHPDQVMWDTDRGWSAPWSMDRDVGLQLVDYSRAFIGKLSPLVQEKYAYQNAEKLFAKHTPPVNDV